jgi:ferrous iron transport protein A
MQEHYPLHQAPVGQSLSLIKIEGDHALIRRLLGLGIRLGTQIMVTQRRGGGVVVANQDARLALGPGLARRLIVSSNYDGSKA